MEAQHASESSRYFGAVVYMYAFDIAYDMSHRDTGSSLLSQPMLILEGTIVLLFVIDLVVLIAGWTGP